MAEIPTNPRDPLLVTMMEAGVPEHFRDTYADALLGLRDRENAALLRTAGFEDAAALLDPDPALFEEAWGDET
ncbi:hypothetical protein [Streptomyces microflavus]|uniref:hypothetical protein n=1 Tax=Streptomyces microflavus TaxID=1919 RepID=UPI003655CEC2